MMELEIRLNGTIMDNEYAEAMRYWGYTDVTCPADIKSKLDEAGGEDITLYINSSGGQLMAGYEMFCDLRLYSGRITAHVQSIAASAATVPMMACDKRVAEVVSILCIHNPSTVAWGDHNEFKKAAEELDTIKNSIINAYEPKLKISREEIAALMDEDKLLDVNQALEYGIIDEVIGDEEAAPLGYVAAAPLGYVAAVGHYTFPTPEMIKQYRQHVENDKKALETQELRLKILSK